MKASIFLISICFYSEALFSQTYTTWTAVFGGDWKTIRWDASGETNCTNCGPPTDGGGEDDEDVIVIDGLTVTMYADGVDICNYGDEPELELSDVVIYVRGGGSFRLVSSLDMCGLLDDTPSIVLNGSGSGIRVEDGNIDFSIPSPLGIYDGNSVLTVDGNDLLDVSDGDQAGPINFPTGHTNDILPVEMINWKTVKVGESVLATWSTATETNNEYFTIEESEDGINFYPIADIPGSGNSSEVLSYQHTFVSISNSDVIYYRIKQTDYDGTYTYSRLITLKNNDADEGYLDIYPNPTTSKTFNLYAAGYEINDIRVIDLTGRIIYEEKIDDLTNESVNTKIALPDANPGTYLVTLLTTEGVKTAKVVLSN